jgi:DNA-directed RNA polymerase specialized sigma24 family protein
MNILSPEAVTQLWDEHATALVLYARQWCDGPEDVVQEAFLLLVRQVVAPDNAVGWLYRVVRNRAINAVRSRGRRSRRETAAAMHGEPWFESSGRRHGGRCIATFADRSARGDRRETMGRPFV